MPGIVDLLPLLDGWSYKSYEFSVAEGQKPIVVKPGRKQTLLEEKGNKGYLLIANVQVTTPFAEMHITAKTPGASSYFDFGVSPYELLLPNLTKPSHVQFWIGNPQMILNTSRLSVAAAVQPLTTDGVSVWNGYPITLHAPASNASRIFVGRSAATAITGSGKSLDPGDSIVVNDVGFVSHLWASGTLGDVLEYAHEIPDVINVDTAFGMNLTPPFPLPYADGFLLELANPSNYPTCYIPGITSGNINEVDASVSYYNAVFLKIDNQSAFEESLRRLAPILR